MQARTAVAGCAVAGVLLLGHFARADDLDNGIQGFERGDYVAAHSSFSSAGEDGDARAAPWLANDYYVAWGVKASDRLAGRWMEIAKAQTSREASEAAVLRWRKLADAGDPAGCVAVGRAYENGIGVTASPVEAHRWYKLAADQGYARGQYALAVMYGAGIGVKTDFKEAVRLLNLAASQGDDWAQHQLGNAYLRGDGVRRNFRTAGEWLRKAAEQGNALAAYNLAVMYDQGDGFSRDYGEAFKWYQRAAAQGVPQAQNNLAVLYYRGQGVPKDLSTALQFSTVADRKDPMVDYAEQQRFDFVYRTIQSELSEAERRAAAFRLGERCRDGDGVPRDAVQAYRYMTAAIDSEPVASVKEERMRARDALAATMRAQQISRAQSLVADFGLP